MGKRIGLKDLKSRHAVDRRMIRDCIRNYGEFKLNEDSVVLDLGCNIGGFQYWLKDSPIKQYIGVDAFEDNIRFYRENNLPDRPNFELFHGAATTSDEETHSFFVYEDDTLGSSNGQSNPSKRQRVKRTKELKVPKEKLNVNGGAIAIGHPIGASGARLIVTLIHEMIKRDNKKGLATLCIGGGMGISMCIARD